MLSKNQTLGKYQILDRIGAGEHGSIYLAKDRLLQDRKVALKVPHHQSDEQGLLLEPRIMAALKHPNIVELITVEKKDDIFFLVLEFVDGESLDKQILRDRALSPARALDIAMDVCSAIGFAHAHQVIHRNICPANILITSNGVAKLSGFGTSRFLDLERDGFARSTRGSPPYMAPEHFRGRAVFQSDLWSLGITFYEMLTGTVPFYDADPVKIAQSFQNTPVVPPHLRNAEVPRALSDVLMKALAINLEDRYLSAQELLKALKAIKESTTQETHPVGTAIPAAHFNTPSQGQPTATQHRLCRFCYRPLPRMAVTCPSCGEKNNGGSYQTNQGRIVPQGHSAEVKVPRQAAEQGDPEAQFNLGFSYSKGNDVPQNHSEAVKWYLNAAEQGHAQAQQCLGVCYYKGEGVPQDYAEAVRWLRKAAEQWDLYAQRNLGYCYEKGQGVPQDHIEAAEWYRKSAEQGNEDAQSRLNLLYALAGDLKEDKTQVLRWYREALEQENADAQFHLGICYAKGQGIPQDFTKAVQWWRRAAEKGNARAQFNLGLCCAKGSGTPRDQVEAVKWYRIAAEQGNADAQYALGVCYDKGMGVPDDHAEAVKWHEKAAEQGNENAQQRLNN
jgi:serine/threonine protein kinase